MTGPRRDLHSGIFGGAVHNSLQALCAIIASLHDAEGRIAIDGVYDNVRQLTLEERSYLSGVSPSDSRFLRDAQAKRGWGERGYSPSERTNERTNDHPSGGMIAPGRAYLASSAQDCRRNLRDVPDSQ